MSQKLGSQAKICSHGVLHASNLYNRSWGIYNQKHVWSLHQDLRQCNIVGKYCFLQSMEIVGCINGSSLYMCLPVCRLCLILFCLIYLWSRRSLVALDPVVGTSLWGCFFASEVFTLVIGRVQLWPCKFGRGDHLVKVRSASHHIFLVFGRLTVISCCAGHTSQVWYQQEVVLSIRYVLYQNSLLIWPQAD